MEPTRWQRIAREAEGDDYAAAYDARFRELADRGDDVHGEAAFVERLRPLGRGLRRWRILDAGCGTGRVAVRLAARGYDVVGVDADAAMLERARDLAPDLEWHEADLATLDLTSTGAPFDVVLVAGNTVPLLEPGTLGETAASLVGHLARGGLMVCGFGLDAAHLPGDCPVTPLAEVEAAFAEAGVEVRERHGGWDQEAVDRFDPADGYVVVVLGRPGELLAG